MIKTLAFSAMALLVGPQVAMAADAALPLCSGSSKRIASDRLLRQALQAAYPTAKERPQRARRLPQPPCLYPYRAVPFDEVVLLITLQQEPGEACHGCAAQLSADFLARDGRRLKPVDRHEAFTEAGTFGSVSSLKPFRLGAREGLVIEGRGTFQGYSSGVYAVFVLQNGRMKEVSPENGISSGDSNCGAKLDDEPCRDVTAEWQVRDGRLNIRYSGVREDGSKIDGSVVYELRDEALVLVSGDELAREMEESRP
jgi:hypothetical protein